ncbi:MAG: sulfatase [Gemmatimonadaceae bacterium]
MTAPAPRPPDHRDRDARTWLALQVALVIYGFTTMVQAQLYLRYVEPALDSSENATWHFLFALPFLQWQTAVAALVVGAAVWWATQRRSWAWGAWFVCLAVLVPVAFDQLVFRRFHDHMTLSQTDGGVLDLGVAIPRLLGSAAFDADIVTYINFAILAVLIPLLYRRLVARTQRPRRAAPHAATLLIIVGAYAALAVPVVRNTRERFDLDRFPLIGLLWPEADAMTEPPGPAPRPADLSRLRDRDWRADRAGDETLYRRAAGLRAAKRRHVLFIVLESVGAHQLLPDGLPDAAVTPNLARLASDALIFPQVYGVYPATTRAHVPIMTGGRNITWGSVGDELTLPLGAPTMVSAFRDAGYHTGLFAAPDLRFGYLREFYRTMPWDTVVHYQDGTPTLTEDQEITSWGVNEDAMRPLIAQWLDEVDDGRPTFVEFQTIASHHPYGTWGGDKGPSDGEDDQARYRNSLHYVDAAIGRLLDDLRARGTLGQTLVVITGDHGEAFADLHTDNWVHRNRLYEENIRNFMFVAAPGLGGGVVVSSRLGQHGDILPTMLSLLGIAAPGVPGQDLTAAGYVPRIAYFHKDSRPAQFGLRDGHWKYIAKLDGRQPELYDLALDPTEQHNLASRNLDRVRLYRDLDAEWYVWANYDYTRLLAGYDTTRRRIVTRANYARVEPPELRIGHFLRGEGEGFVETPVMAPNDPVVIWNRWNFLPDDIDVRIRLVSPRRAVFEYDFHIAAEWEVSWYHPGLDFAKDQGVWEASIWSKGDRLATERFEVRKSVVPAMRDDR